MRHPHRSSLLAFLASGLSTVAAEHPPLRFNTDVRPILSENCFACHGFDKNSRKADLRLDVMEEKTREVLAPGRPDESELLARIHHEDPDERMPPAEAKKSLTASQKDTLRRWIAEGAPFEQHWAFLPPAKAAVPEAFAGRAIDYFVGTRLAAEGLALSPVADRATLARRLYFDLTGLPPGAAEVAAFEGDAAPDAYARLVDRLLASPHFGERMALQWLDLVRYADTVGYHGDQPVSVWPFRDYVIDAFNANMPFDRFTREQIAGDLLPDATTDQRVASGYNRLNMTTEEGGSQPKEYLAKYASDRVRTTSVTWMGATLGCAECHDHKFDPYTMRDFYSFAAFFADIEEVGVYGNTRPPQIPVPTGETRRKLAAIEARLTEARARMDAASANLGEGQAKWETGTRAHLASNTAEDFVWLADAPPAGAALSPGWNAVGQDNGHVFAGERAWKQESAGMVQLYFNKSPQPVTLAEGDVFFVNVWLDPAKTPETLMLQAHSEAHGTWEHRAFWGADKISYGGIGADTPAHRPRGALPEAGKWVRLEVPVDAVGFAPGQTVDGFSFDQFGGLAYWDQAGIRTRESPALKGLPNDVRVALAVDAGARDEAQRALIAAHYRTNAPELLPMREAIAALEAEKIEVGNAMPTTLITVSQTPRTMRVLPRGNWLDESGPEVLPAVPEFLGGPVAPEAGRLSRLDLADWLVSSDNPLTARVFVNRMWKLAFGTGLSKVLDDLGSQGEWPTHPELLDWLAVDFMENGWDMKRLARTIVLSDTYRQSSMPKPELREHDPYNRLLARQSRFRVEAEFVRDAALAVSGLLVDRRGGRSARPYQPAKYYEHLNFPRREYEPDTGDNQYRRGVYTHWQRTFLHPMLKAFDAATREECTANRERSNTPLQALALLNDPTFLEASRAFAARVMTEGSGDFAHRLKWAFHEALSRPPTAEEASELAALHARHWERFRNDPGAAAEYLAVGLSPPPADLDPAELAAWMSVSRVVFNLHEMIARY